MQKLDPMHVEIVEFSSTDPCTAREYSADPASREYSSHHHHHHHHSTRLEYSRLAEEVEEDDREYLVGEYSTRLQQQEDSSPQEEFIKAEPGKEQDFIALVNDSIGYCYDTSHQVKRIKVNMFSNQE